MQILNMCVFASTNEIGALILQFKKMSGQSKNPPFSPTTLFLENVFRPHPYCQIRGTESRCYSVNRWQHPPDAESCQKGHFSTTKNL